MNLKCPNCGGPFVYDVESDMMKCSYCNCKMSIDEFSKKNDKSGLSLKMKETTPETSTNHVSLKMKETTSETSTDYFSLNETEEDRKPEEKTLHNSKELQQENTQQWMEMKIYHCSSCGADLMIGQTQSSTFCSYCGSPSIVYERLSKEAKPAKIIPFKLSQKQALSCVKDRFAAGSYIPKAIKELSPDKIRAIYIPYWLYTSYVRKKTTITAQNDGNHYTYYRDADCTYKYMPADASLKLSNKISQRLEPYYMNELEDFDIAYLSGYYADKHDVPVDTFYSQIKKQCFQYIDSAIFETCPHAASLPTKNGYINNYTESDKEEEYELQDTCSALLPAYFVHIPYNGQKELIIINGQTGKVIGNLPFDNKQIIFKFIKNAAISCTIFCILSILLFSVPGIGAFMIVPAIFALATLISGINSYKKYISGIQQLHSQHMTLYSNRKEME